MESRSALGAADVSDARLAALVADLLRVDAVRLLDARVERVDYDLPALTTGGRWWVVGHADVDGERVPFRVFVKLVQSWTRSPVFAFVPAEVREIAAAGVPWRTEPEVYRSDVGERLPAGLSTPRALAVDDLDELSCAIWLEEVPVRAVAWDRARYARAAHLLGRLSGSTALAPLAGLRDVVWDLGVYARGRIAGQVRPVLASEELWQHPLCAAFDADLVARLRSTAARAEELAAEGDALPRLLSHGDACPNNLLAGADPDGFVLIDFGFWGGAPVGFDLSQLLVGEVQLGRRGTEDLAELDEALVAAYVAGLRAEGCDVPEQQVRRAHALCLLLMTGLSAVPSDMLDGPVDEHTLRVAADRAVLSRYALDLEVATR